MLYDIWVVPQFFVKSGVFVTREMVILIPNIHVVAIEHGLKIVRKLLISCSAHFFCKILSQNACKITFGVYFLQSKSK